MTEILKWLDGNGWLILAGSADPLSDIRAQALARIQTEGAVVYIGMDESDLDDLMDDFGELGAPTGYILNIRSEDDETIRSNLSQASMIFLPGSYPAKDLQSMLQGAGIEGLRTGYENGTVIFAEGNAASLFGKIIVLDEEHTIDGFGWIENSIVMADVTSISETARSHQLLSTHFIQVVIGIHTGGALVLGKNNHIETWGEDDLVMIALGRY